MDPTAGNQEMDGGLVHHLMPIQLTLGLSVQPLQTLVARPTTPSHLVIVHKLSHQLALPMETPAGTRLKLAAELPISLLPTPRMCK